MLEHIEKVASSAVNIFSHGLYNVNLMHHPKLSIQSFRAISTRVTYNYFSMQGFAIVLRCGESGRESSISVYVLIKSAYRLGFLR